MKLQIKFLAIFFSVFVFAQEHDNMELSQVSGQVVYDLEGEDVPLSYIKVYWKEMPGMQTVTDEDGNFTLNYHDGLYHIVAESDGFKTQDYAYDGQDFVKIILPFEEEETSLSEVEIKSKINSLTLNSKSVFTEFTINSDEFLKAACCNLSESFDTNPSVDVAYNDAVTGTKEIKLLGLNQRYTSYSRSNISDLSGLATYDGLEFYPGRWISSMQLAKGTPSVTTNHDAITGMINLELFQFDKDPTTSLNFYLSENARAEGNVVSTQKLNDKWSNAMFLHGSSRFQKIDRNKDGFLDTPLSTQLNIANVLRYNDLAGKGWNSFIGFQVMTLDKTGGQTDYDSQEDRLTTNAYGVESDTKRLVLWNKIGKVFNNQGRSLGFLQQYTHHYQQESFGIVPYDGIENRYEAKLIFQDFIGNTNHQYKVGSSFYYDGFDEDYNYSSYKRNERDFALFGEYEYSYLEKLKILGGLRVDFHNLAGTQFLPKLHMKYLPFSKTSLRLTVGRAFRTANIWEENQKYMVSQRYFVVLPSEDGKIYGLKPEIAWNYGISLSQEFRLFYRKSNIVLDYFRTEFQDQVIPDADNSTHYLLLYNNVGKSVYNSFQALLTTSITNNFDVRLAYKYYKTDLGYISGRNSAPFVPENRGFLNLSYETDENNGKSWMFDTTFQFVGKMRLPKTSENPEPFRRPDNSKSFMTLNAQVNRNFSDHFRMYLGAQNITSYTQKQPIIEVENPFGDYFDASMIYAPIMPINFYVGLDINF